MKNYLKLAISSLFLAFSLTTSAQLKVFSDGHISALSSFTQAKSPISINCLGDTTYLISAEVENKRGMYCKISNTENKLQYAGMYVANAPTIPSIVNSAIGLRADATGSGLTGTRRAFGLMGIGNSGAVSMGAYGSIGTCGKGAAIFGTTTSNYGTVIPEGGVYAGFFNGNVMITGDLTLSGSMNGVLLGESSNSVLSGSEEQNGERSMLSVSERMAGLQATVFQKAEPSYYSTKESTVVDEEFGEEVAPKPTFIEEQYYNKNHYALSAEQLEKVFPDLVYEQEDGTKAINYVEMIPLLVQTINELQDRLATLENDETPKSRIANETSNVTSPANTPAVVAKLAQNTPNPFTERTTIRFTLPEDVQNAYIYIFDMTGKMQKQLPVDASMQSITINGYELSAGMYIYSLVVNGKEVDTKRMILSR